MADNYYRVKWSAYAMMDSKRLDLFGFDITYALDQIPEATFSPVVGRDGRSGTEADAIDALLNAAPYTPIKIYVRGETEQDSPQTEPGFQYNTDVLIFDGVYQGVVYQSRRQVQNGLVVIGAKASGWLVGLEGTSAATNKTTIKGPGGFYDIANVGLPANPNSTAIFNLSTAISDDPEVAVDDLWVDFIKPLFESIATTEEVWGDTENDSALAALDRMDGDISDADTTLSLNATRGALSKKTVGEWMISTLAKALYVEWRERSLWGALLWAARQFTFRIVPLIDTATCAPVFGALGGDAYIIIGADEYHDANIQFATPQLITKVVVLQHNAVVVDPFASGPRYSAVVGVASADDLSGALPYEGALIEVVAPDWLASEPSAGGFAKVSLGKNQIGIPDAANPDAFQYSPSADEDYAQIYSDFIRSEMGDRYARLVLLNEMLSSRGGSIAGRFRLDIAPGSTVAVEVIGSGKFSSNSDDPKYIYGLVEAVKITMEAGSGTGAGSASTSFALRNIMTAQEHDGYLGLMTETEHPVFQAAFRGAKLTGD